MATVVLSAGDPIAFGLAIREISAVGEAMLVDPYFRLEELAPVLTTTEVDRVLTSGGTKSRKADLAGICSAFGKGVAAPHGFEIRSSGELHDRWVIPDVGDVRFIGCSLNGIGGRSLTVMGALKDGGDQIRAHFEAVWKDAEVVVSVGQEESSEPGDHPGSP